MRKWCFSESSLGTLTTKSLNQQIVSVGTLKSVYTLNHQHSKAKSVASGIPQGSCLGPLPFIVYLNDLEKYLKFSRASIYADDTNITIVYVTKPVEDAHELSNLSEWR